MNDLKSQTPIPVPFHGDTLYLIEHNGEPYAPAKPVCEALGLSWSSQTIKINRNTKRWSVSMIETVAEDGKSREMLCMPLRKFPAWLAGIQPSKVHVDLRPKLERYQEECDDVLWRYWNEGHAVNPRHDPEPAAPKGLMTISQRIQQLEDERDGAYKMVCAHLATWEASEKARAIQQQGALDINLDLQAKVRSLQAEVNQANRKIGKLEAENALLAEVVALHRENRALRIQGGAA